LAPRETPGGAPATATQAEHLATDLHLASDERTWAMAAHLSALLLAIGPLVVYLMKKDQSEFIGDQAREALNFQLTLMGFWILLLLCVGPVLTVMTAGVGLVVMVPLLLAYIVGAIVLPLNGAMKANRGIRYRYPAIVRFIK
jgi:uncharacterized Tic20 family protein